MCVGSWTGVTYLRYIALASPKKDETAVVCCDLFYRLLSCFLSRNGFHVVAALQSIVWANNLIVLV